MQTDQFIRDCERIRTQSPLVLNITNYVAMTSSANALLAIGASPLMSFYPAEMQELVSLSSALVINIGCLDEQLSEAAHIAADTAHKMAKPWVLDPVGAGASKERTRLAQDLIELYHPHIIRANASEVQCLAGQAISSRGVDAACSSTEVVELAKELARISGAVVSMSGAVDFITDGQRVESIANGSPIMPRVTATGCTASAITGAFAAVDKDAFAAALGAMAMMGLAGEKAAARTVGTGSFAVALLDELSCFDAGVEIDNLRQ